MQLALAANRLFNQLYDRHARRDFVHLARDHWHWPQVYSRELSEAMGGGAAGGAGPGSSLLGGAAAAEGGGLELTPRVSMVLTCIPQVTLTIMLCLLLS